MSDDLGPWPEKVYLLHPSIKSFGGMVTNPERREYVLAETAEAKITKALEAIKEIKATVVSSKVPIAGLIWHQCKVALAELEGGE